jgi:DNA polymerase alpha subunit B
MDPVFTGGRPTSIVVAAGPFTTRSELSFEPLEELLATAAQQGAPPTALLLAGPFLDAAHPVVAAGQLETPLQHVFEQEVCVFIASRPTWYAVSCMLS